MIRPSKYTVFVALLAVIWIAGAIVLIIMGQSGASLISTLDSVFLMYFAIDSYNLDRM